MIALSKRHTTFFNRNIPLKEKQKPWKLSIGSHRTQPCLCWSQKRKLQISISLVGFIRQKLDFFWFLSFKVETRTEATPGANTSLSPGETWASRWYQVGFRCRVVTISSAAGGWVMINIKVIIFFFPVPAIKHRGKSFLRRQHSVANIKFCLCLLLLK